MSFAGVSLQIMIGTTLQALLLTVVNTRSRPAEPAVPAVPDLDEYELTAIVHNQVNLAMTAAIVFLFHGQSRLTQKLHCCSFGCLSLA